jgi:hypothetical protein
MAASGLARISSSNSTSSTPVDRAPPSSRRRGKLQNRGSRRDDGIGPFDGHEPGSERNTGTPTFCSHRDSLISSRSPFCSDRCELPLRLQNRGRYDSADVSTSVCKQSEFSDERGAMEFNAEAVAVPPASVPRLCAKRAQRWWIRSQGGVLKRN